MEQWRKARDAKQPVLPQRIRTSHLNSAQWETLGHGMLWIVWDLKYQGIDFSTRQASRSGKVWKFGKPRYVTNLSQLSVFLSSPCLSKGADLTHFLHPLTLAPVSTRGSEMHLRVLHSFLVKSHHNSSFYWPPVSLISSQVTLNESLYCAGPGVSACKISR